MCLNHLIVSYSQVVVILYLTLPTTLIKISKFQLMEYLSDLHLNEVL